MIKITDALGYETKYEYDYVGNLIKEVDAKGNFIEYEYDDLNRLRKVIRPFETKKNVDNRWIMFLSIIVDILTDNLFLKKYLENHHPLISKWLFKYYQPLSYGEDYSTREFEYDPVGNIIAKIDPNGFRTEFEYNERNELVKIINPEKESIIFTYDSVGNQKTTLNPNGNTITYNYDNNDKLIEITDSIGQLYIYTYNSVGNLLTETDANGNSITYEYDSVDRLITIHDAMGESISYVYDSVGNLLISIDRNDNPTSYVYNDVNKRIAITDALGYTTQYDYDCCNLIKITDANGHATSYQYDVLNRLILETFADGTTKEYTYDQVGNLISLKNQLGKITNYEYNDLYYLEKRDYHNDNDDVFTYDKAGRMLTARNSNSIITFEYDKAGRILKTKQNDYCIEYEYDIPNNIRIIKYPIYKKLKNTHTMTYQESKNVIETRDKRNRLKEVEVIGEGNIVHYEYDDANRLLSKTYYNDVKSDYKYNENNWVTSISHKKNSILLAGYIYDYDKENNYKYAENLLTFDSGKAYTYSERYTYDVNYQLIGYKTGELVNGDIISSYETCSWIFDPIGNWNQFTFDGIAYQNTPNQMNEYDDPSTDGPPPVPDDDGIPDDFKDVVDTIIPDGFNLCHDKNGNLVEDGNNIYEYDYCNNLISVTRKSDNKVLEKYRYDPLGRRVEKDTANETIVYLYDNSRVIEDRIYKSTTAQYIYGDGIDEVLAMYRNNELYIYHSNPLGSNILITDADGDIAEIYTYNAYGEVNVFNSQGINLHSSAIENPYLFTGRRLDNETGLYYYRARYYNPSLGRFMSRDPVFHLNLYRYANNNPIALKDPFGEDTRSDVLKKLKELEKLPELAKLAKELIDIICNDKELTKEEAKELIEKYGKQLFDLLMGKLGWYGAALLVGLEIGGQIGTHFKNCLQSAINKQKCLACIQHPDFAGTTPVIYLKNEKIWCITQGEKTYACWEGYEDWFSELLAQVGLASKKLFCADCHSLQSAN
jgi:RHS repeat-associated protein